MPEFLRNHIVINQRTETQPYTSISQGRSKVIIRTGIDRLEQGAKINSEFTSAVNEFSINIPNQNFVYVVFKSTPNFLIDLDKFDQSGGNIRLACYKILYEDNDTQIYEATVYLNTTAVDAFLKKVNDYLDQEKDTKNGNPKNQSLIANLDTIRAATLKSFWQEPELSFPEFDHFCWWEIWISKKKEISTETQLNSTFEILQQKDEIEIGSSRWLDFPEHLVFLVKATPQQLAETILYSNSLSELRKPKETADYFLFLDKAEQSLWIENLSDRIQSNIHNSNISICLLDTGVNHTHPLLIQLISETNLDTIEPHWSKADTDNQGHGTPMAGMSYFGDLGDAFNENAPIPIYHHLESVKIIEKQEPNNPNLYGAITIEAVARAGILNPNHKRIVCMAVTSDQVIHNGRPSSWSAAIDQLLFGTVNDPNVETLMFISAGNLPIAERINTPLINDDYSCEDPTQAFNAITVGAYTLKDSLDYVRFPDATLISVRGGMAPCNTTSIGWDQEWPRKPDIVMEGGNHGVLDNDLIDPDSLQLLSTSKGGLGRSWLTSFGDTSAATALAVKFAAELYYFYPTLWPESIRGLIVHSADWTSAMLTGKNIFDLSSLEKLKLIARVGYGVPNLHAARYSASNSLCLIVERLLKPYKFEEGRVKTEDFHLIDLPWPVEALQEMAASTVNLKVTLSYFIEPNPGSRNYELAASYRSHGLRFKMKGSQESDSVFSARVSKDMRDESYVAEGSENWILGSQVRDKGSIHKDIWRGSAADLATRNKIAVFPVGGWWKGRKQLERYNFSIRYSLIISIDTPDNGIDIYTPVQIQVPIEP